MQKQRHPSAALPLSCAYSLYINDKFQNTIFLDNGNSFSLAGLTLKSGDELTVKANLPPDTNILGPVGSFEIEGNLTIGYVDKGEKNLRNSVQGFYNTFFPTNVKLSTSSSFDGTNITLTSKIGEEFYSLTRDKVDEVNLMKTSIEKVSCEVYQEEVNRSLKTIKSFPYLKIYRKSKYSDVEVVEVSSSDGELVRYDKNGEFFECQLKTTFASFEVKCSNKANPVLAQIEPYGCDISECNQVLMQDSEKVYVCANSSESADSFEFTARHVYDEDEITQHPAISFINGEPLLTARTVKMGGQNFAKLRNALNVTIEAKSGSNIGDYLVSNANAKEMETLHITAGNGSQEIKKSGASSIILDIVLEDDIDLHDNDLGTIVSSYMQSFHFFGIRIRYQIIANI